MDFPVRQTYYWPKGDGKPALACRAFIHKRFSTIRVISSCCGAVPAKLSMHFTI
jgi:hypothetical protein